jgi:sugar phosphate isomerase/epimerase
MILSTQSSHLSERFGEIKAIKILKWAGYDAIDFSMFNNLNRPDHPLSQNDYREYALQMRQVADDAGIVFSQAHAPFPTYKAGDDAYNEKTFADIVRSLEIAAILGASIVIVHPVYLPDIQEKKAFNMSLYRRLQPYCESLEIKVALENMWGRDETGKHNVPVVCSTGDSFCEYLDALDSRYFTACLDLGHCGLVGEDAAAMIRTLGHRRLLSLHVHDNNFRDDTHTVPFMGQMDWQAITAALADINYAGDLTLEADGFLKGYPDAFLPQAARFMQEIGRHLIRMIDA